jgi:hypothetical protein
LAFCGASGCASRPPVRQAEPDRCIAMDSPGCKKLLGLAYRILPAQPPSEITESFFERTNATLEAMIGNLPEKDLLVDLQDWLDVIHRVDPAISSRKGFLPGMTAERTLKRLDDVRNDTRSAKNVLGALTQTTNPEVAAVVYDAANWMTWRDYCAGRFMLARFLSLPEK